MVAASSSSIIKTDQGMSVSGALTFSSVKEVLSQGNEYINEGSFEKESTFIIDCSSIKHIDSAGIALLVEWQRQCINKDINSRYVGLLDQPKSLIKTYQLESSILV